MKIATLFGTRPEIIRLSLIIGALDASCDHVLIHTGQNYDPSLSQLFLDELEVRPVDHHLGVASTSFGEQAGLILARSEEILRQVRPDRLVILGDTNSGLAAIVAARMRIATYHLEAGNRCYDNRVPEEINRRIIDHSSEVLLPYTHRSAANLVAEGISRERIFVVGNPILEVLEHSMARIERSDVLDRLAIGKGRYFLATMHRAENVDDAERLRTLLAALERLARELELPVIVSVHPRTAERIAMAGASVDSRYVRLERPFGLFDFVKLEKNARGIVTDSGTVQEEACIFGIPNVTIRDATERPETLECGSNILVGADSNLLIAGMRLALEGGGDWERPAEYMNRNVSAAVAKIILGYRMLR